MKYVKIALLTIAGLLLLLIIALVAAVNLIDINRHHDRIAQMVHDQTGRELQIEGDLEWGLWPRLYLNGGPLQLGNAPGFETEPFLSLESFRFSVATWPLIRSQIHMDTLVISGLLVNLERNQEGVGNWEDLVEEPEPKPEPDEPPEREEMPFAALALGGVDVDDVTINWHDHQSGQQARVSDLRLLVGALTFGEPIEMALDFTATANQPELEVDVGSRATLLYEHRASRYAAQPLEVTASFRGPTVPGDQADLNLHTLLELDRATGRAEIEDFRLEGLGTMIQAQVSMHDLEADIPGCQGEVTVNIADLVQLLEIFESPLADQLADVQERSIRLATEFSFDPDQGQVMIPSLEARLLGTTFNGHLVADEIHSSRPEVQGGIIAEGPDLPALLAVASRLQPEADQEALSRALAGLDDRSLMAEATFSSEGEDIVIPRLHFQGLATELDAEARLSKLDAEMPALEGRARIAGDDLPRLLKVASAFQGGPEARVNDEPALGAELWGLAQQAADAGQHTFSLATDFTADLDEQRLTASNLTARALGLELTAGLTAREILSDEPDFDLDLALAPFNARRLLTILDVELPETADSQVLTSLALNAVISGTPNQFTVKPLAVTLDDTNIEGEITIHDLEHQDLAFNIDIDDIDLDRYLPPESEEQPATPEAAAAGAALLPVELLRQLRLDGNLRIARLKISGLRIEDFIMGIKARDGQIKVDPLNADLYQGEMVSTIAIDARQELPEIATTNRLSGIQAGPLLRDLTGSQEKIRGRSNISYDLNTRGAEIDDLKAQLGGEASFEFKDGAVVGINIGRLLRQTRALVESRTLAAEPEEVTDFTSLTGSAQIEEGLISNRDLSLMSPLLRVSGKGSAHLVSEEVDYLLTATVVGTDEGQEGAELEALRGISVPIRVRGTFDDLTFRPSLGDAAQQKLKENLLRLEDQLRQEGVRALEGLLGVPERPDEDPEAEEQKPEEGLEEQLKDELRRRLPF